MTPTATSALLKKLGIVPSKKMGQNFLVDDNFLAFIIREAAIKKGEKVLEIGPGLGVLTKELLSAGADVTAIELDRKLAAYNRETLCPKGLRLEEGDACRKDIPSLMGQGQDFKLISNLPYSAASVIIANMLLYDNPPSYMVIMLQKEVAQRFAAKPDTDEYSALSVRIQAMYDVTILKNIPPEVFFPRPDVDSALVRLELKTPLLSLEDRTILSRTARTAFAHRRKKMFKQLVAVFGQEETEKAILAAGIDPDIRAEKVTVEGFLALAKSFRGQ